MQCHESFLDGRFLTVRAWHHRAIVYIVYIVYGGDRILSTEIMVSYRTCFAAVHIARTRKCLTSGLVRGAHFSMWPETLHHGTRLARTRCWGSGDGKPQLSVA